MAKRIALAVLFLATLAVAAAYGSAFLPGGAPAWAPWSMALGMTAALAAMMTVGASRRGKVGRLGVVFVLVFLGLGGGFAVVLAMPATDPANPSLWFGLPPRAAIVMYGIGVLPLFLVPVAYALTFDRMTLSDEDLARVREAGERRAAEAAAAARLGSGEAAGGAPGVAGSRRAGGAGTDGGP